MEYSLLHKISEGAESNHKYMYLILLNIIILIIHEMRFYDVFNMSILHWVKRRPQPRPPQLHQSSLATPDQGETLSR